MPYRTHMKFALQAPTSTVNVVLACSTTEIRVREHLIRSSVILTATEIMFDWPATIVAELTPEHFRRVLALRPELILLGTGERQIFPDARVVAAVHGAGVGFEVMDTRAACRTYNVLLQEGRHVAAALILDGTPEAGVGR